MTIKEFSFSKIQDLKTDVMLEILVLVEARFSGKKEATEIAEIHTKLKANRYDQSVLSAALAYCSDGWIFGPIN